MSLTFFGKKIFFLVFNNIFLLHRIHVIYMSLKKSKKVKKCYLTDQRN